MSKASVFFRFLGGLAIGLTVLLLLVIRVTSCAPLRAPPPGVPAAEIKPGPVDTARADCRAQGWTAAAELNSGSLRTLAWAPFGRDEVGWEIYAPLIQHEIGTTCPPASEAFA